MARARPSWKGPQKQDPLKPSLQPKQQQRQTNPPCPSNFPAANRGFFALRTVPETLQDAEIHATSIPLAFVEALPAQNAEFGLWFSTTIYLNGMVTIQAAPLLPESSYAPFFALLTIFVNSSLPVRANPYKTLSTTPTNADYVIHRLPVSALPEDPPLISETITEAVKFSCGAAITSARFLQMDPSRRTARSSSIVLSVPLEEIKRVSSTIVLFSGSRSVEKMILSTLATQCRKCYEFGHNTTCCKQTVNQCPLSPGV